MPGIFITGTDTGVGKTFVTLRLAREFMAKGVDIAVMKPISTGSISKNDAYLLKNKLKLKDPIELINPIRLKYPLAPLPASQLEKKKLNLQKIFRAYKKLEALHELVLVEGIGGVLVPIKKDYFVADLIKDMQFPAIIVARAGLGTINHTLLTVEALKKREIEILGIIMNGFSGKELSEKSNAEIIYKTARIPILAKIGLQHNRSR